MNTEVLFSSKNEVWATPQDFFDKLNEEFHFNLDPCATPENRKCSRFFTAKENGLEQDWGGGMWFSATRLMVKTLRVFGLRKPMRKAASLIPP